jgi:hypothetical protein
LNIFSHFNSLQQMHMTAMVLYLPLATRYTGPESCVK